MFSFFRFLANCSWFKFIGLWFYILLYSVLGQPIRKTCCVFNQSEARQTPNICTFSHAYCRQYVSCSFYDWQISYLKFLIDLLRYCHFFCNRPGVKFVLSKTNLLYDSVACFPIACIDHGYPSFLSAWVHV